MTLLSYEFRSPSALIEQVADEVPLVPGTTYVVLVAHPSTEQRIVAIRRLEAPTRADHWQEARQEIYDVMQELAIPETPSPPQHSAILVVVRRGRCVFGPDEGAWLNAWKFSNHLTNAFTGGLILVTEHGWADLMTDTAGHTPALVA